MKPQIARIFRLLPVLAASAGALSAGTVSGRVSLVENGRSRSDASNVAVWIEGAHFPEKVPEPTPAKSTLPTPSMKSLHKKFTPKTIVVELGHSVSFPNEDWIYHNVFSVSGENHFDLGLYRRGRSKDKKFEAPGLVRVYCNIHPQMIGFVRVVDSSYFAVTTSDGTFAFENVPDGERTVKAWCDEGSETGATVQVSPRRIATASLSLDVSAFKPLPHKNKYGQDYPPPPEDEDRY
jgi:plastocyanin